MKKINIAFLGIGSIIGEYSKAIKYNADRCNVVAAASLDLSDVMKDRARKLLGNQIDFYDNYDGVLKRDDVDAVIVALPHDMHMPATVAAAKAGKHVLCEKVMARNINECQAMIDACDEAGVSLVVGHDRRYSNDWKAIKDIVDSCRLGKILFYKLEHNQNNVFPKGHWIRNSEKLGGGAIISCLSHQIDALRWFDGEAESVSCMSVTEPMRMEGESIGVVTAKMKSGALAYLSINWATTSNRAKNGLWFEMIHITGTDGEVYFLSDGDTYESKKRIYVKYFDERDRISDQFQALTETTGDFQEIKTEQIAPHAILLKEWLKYLAGEDSNVRTFGKDSIKTVEFAQAAYLARETEKYIHLPLTI